MRRVAVIALLTVLVVCAPKFLRRAATPPAAISPDAGLKLAVSSSEEISTESPSVSPVAQAEPDVEAVPLSAEQLSAQKYRKLQIACLAERPAVEAVVVEEVENGQVIFAAPKDNTLESKLAEVTKPGSSNPSSDLLSMFQMEFNSQNKSDILVSANLLPADYNLWSLLEAGLSPSQPPEVRAQAAAYAMVRNPDLLLNHLNDPDPLVQLEIQNGLIGNASPTIVHRGLPPVDRNKPRPYRKNTN